MNLDTVNIKLQEIIDIQKAQYAEDIYNELIEQTSYEYWLSERNHHLYGGNDDKNNILDNMDFI